MNETSICADHRTFDDFVANAEIRFDFAHGAEMTVGVYEVGIEFKGHGAAWRTSSVHVSCRPEPLVEDAIVKKAHH